MKKLIIVLAVIALIAGLGLFYFGSKLDGIIANTIETEGSAMLGTQVEVGQVTTKISDGSASIDNLTVANPSGYQSEYALLIEGISAEVNYRSQSIDKIEINKPIINAELIGTKNNFQDLLNNIPSSADVESANQEDELELTIAQLSMREATVNLTTRDLSFAGRDIDLGDRSFVMDDFIVRDLSGTTDQITQELTQQLTRHISNQIQRYAAEEIAKLAKDKASEKINELLEDKLGDKLKGFKLK